jgi:hypothetical protein
MGAWTRDVGNDTAVFLDLYRCTGRQPQAAFLDFQAIF